MSNISAPSMVKYTVSQQVRSVMGMPRYLARLARFNLEKIPPA